MDTHALASDGIIWRFQVYDQRIICYDPPGVPVLSSLVPSTLRSFFQADYLTRSSKAFHRGSTIRRTSFSSKSEDSLSALVSIPYLPFGVSSLWAHGVTQRIRRTRGEGICLHSSLCYVSSTKLAGLL